MSLDPFEEDLRRQRLKPVPEIWREEILQVASAAAEPRGGLTRTFSWRDLLWPCPQAWAGLATAWVVILFFFINSEDARSNRAPTSTPLAASESWRRHLEERRLLSEWLSREHFPSAEPPKPTGTRTHSELEKSRLNAV